MFWWILLFLVGSTWSAPFPNNSDNNSTLRQSRSLRYRNNIGNQCDCVCGAGGSGSRIRVLGGSEVRPHEFPWLAGISAENKFLCGASLITRKHLLTAAHCVQGYDLAKMRVSLGDHDRTSTHDGVQHRVRRARIHVGFEPRTYNNDITILELENPVEFNSLVQPVCLPQGVADYTSKMGVIAGWGFVEERGTLSNVPLKLNVPVWSRKDCLEVTEYQISKVTENMFCAGYKEGGRDACQGDSGGPLHVKNEFGSMDVIGLVSWGRGCGRPKLPGLYTKVDNYLDWINESIRGECLCQPASQFPRKF